MAAVAAAAAAEASTAAAAAACIVVVGCPHSGCYWLILVGISDHLIKEKE